MIPPSAPGAKVTTPRIVVFDLGRVLVDFDYAIAAGRLSARGNLDADAALRVLCESPLLARYESGQITSHQFYQEVRRQTGFRGDFEEFGTCFSDIFTEIPPMVALHGHLRARGLPMFVFSNTNELAVGHIRRRFPFFSEFRDYFLSFAHGVMKPDPAFYQVVERQTAHAGPEILFIDDRPENVGTALARDWQAIQHANPAETRAAVAQLNLLG